MHNSFRFRQSCASRWVQFLESCLCDVAASLRPAVAAAAYFPQGMGSFLLTGLFRRFRFGHTRAPVPQSPSNIALDRYSSMGGDPFVAMVSLWMHVDIGSLSFWSSARIVLNRREQQRCIELRHLFCHHNNIPAQVILEGCWRRCAILIPWQIDSMLTCRGRERESMPQCTSDGALVRIRGSILFPLAHSTVQPGSNLVDGSASDFIVSLACVSERQFWVETRFTAELCVQKAGTTSHCCRCHRASFALASCSSNGKWAKACAQGQAEPCVQRADWRSGYCRCLVIAFRAGVIECRIRLMSLGTQQLSKKKVDGFGVTIVRRK